MFCARERVRRKEDDEHVPRATLCKSSSEQSSPGMAVLHTDIHENGVEMDRCDCMCCHMRIAVEMSLSLPCGVDGLLLLASVAGGGQPAQTALRPHCMWRWPPEAAGVRP